MICSLSIFALFSVILCISAKYRGSKYQLLIFKPLTLVLIISILFVVPTTEQNYRMYIFLGLLFSLIGDVFLIFPKQHFKNGLVAFLIGHIFYIIAFSTFTGFQYTLWIYVPIIIIGLVYFKNIVPYAEKIKIPLIIYVMVIAIMGWMALERLNSMRTIGSLFAASGAVLFMVSDSMLAINKFRKSFFSAELIILSTYYTAQWLLALSTIGNS